ncbi:MAG: tetratricopeptide repeat protein [Proteobacteria bacterium]|nr:tetratricopeptide repeat protein [Pseudomonadota bacterium]
MSATQAFAQDSQKITEKSPSSGILEPATSDTAQLQNDNGSDAREKLLRDADTLIKSGKATDAYRLLEPFEFDRSGEIRFDYLLGIAALDSGKPDKATLAFERVLTVNPDFAGARLDMARAYYQLGDIARAKTEFEAVMTLNPPAGAKITIQKYLDTISAAERSKQTRISGYLEGVMGHDSNVNTGTGSSIAVASLSPGLAALITGLTGNLNPQISASQRADDYSGINMGGEISHSLNTNWQIYAGADARQHGNMTQTPYDSISTDGRFGAMYTEAKNVWKLTATGGQNYLANSMRRDTLGTNAEFQHTFNPANQVNTFVQYGRNRAAGSPSTAPGTDARTTGNTDLILAGAGWLHAMSGGRQLVYASVYTGKELDAAPANIIQPPDGKRRFDGIRLGGQLNVNDQLDEFASIGWQHAIFSKPNAFIVNNGLRNEYQYDLTLGANWHLDKRWSVKPQISMYRKNSNLAIYSYDRTDVSLTLRRDFK